MPVGPDTTRLARAEDFEEIDRLLTAAFGQPDEALLVRRLRADGVLWQECVMPWRGVIAGYAALSRMRAPEGWACLAPVAVLPRFQNGAAAPNEDMRRTFAIGTRIVRELAESLDPFGRLRSEGKDVPSTIVVLGKPSFYERAGFSLARAQRLTSPYPLDHTLIARPGDDLPEETLVYPAAFGS